ncbi:MAG: hypothetical protein DKT66_01065 [Candidatus Melainabacteria bacterium]|nr:MAG: hypothetical protein DKT66_01065 [Candidatus Melainabacteria bacterium]
MDFHTLEPIFSEISRLATSDEYSVPFWAAILWLLLLLNRRASLRLLWRKLHIFQDSTLETEAYSKINAPLQAFLLLLAGFPFLRLLPHGIGKSLTPLAICITGFLGLHVFVCALDLALFGWFFAKRQDANVPSIFRFVVLTAVYVGVGLILLNVTLGINIMPLLATSTIITAVFGFALQDTLKNLFSGLTMSFEKRFKQGDWIQVGTDPATSTLGQVVEIGWRSTKVRLKDNDFAVIPNQQCTASLLVNLTSPKSTHLISIDFPVKHKVDVEKLRTTLVKLASGVEGVVKEPPVELLAVGIKTDHLILRLRFWIEDLLKKDQVQSEIIEKTFKKLAQDDLLPSSDSK